MRRKEHVVRWRSVGAAATFLLAVLAGVAGNQLTGRLSVALVVFAVLVVAGMFVTYSLDHRASAHNQPDGAVCEAGRVDLGSTQGVQIGSHNLQIYLGTLPQQAPLAAADTDTAVSPGEAVSGDCRLRVEGKETHDWFPKSSALPVPERPQSLAQSQRPVRIGLRHKNQGEQSAVHDHLQRVGEEDAGRR